MTRPLFDTVLVIDWSARSRPSPARPSKDAIWLGLARVEGGDARVEEPVYCRTRADAFERIASLLAAEVAADRRVLAGFDFPFGYPAGTAAAVTEQASALALWDWLAERIKDDANNVNNRFEVAGTINRLFPGEGPFWGHHRAHEWADIESRNTARYGTDCPAEKRLADEAARTTSSVWQLFSGAHVVGSQALLGIPAVAALRRRLHPEAAVWPFETGLAAPEAPVVLAEVYPSLLRSVVHRILGGSLTGRTADFESVSAGSSPAPRTQDVQWTQIVDAVQVWINAAAFAQLAAEGGLDALFKGSPKLSLQDRAVVEREEGWILGVGFEADLKAAAEKALTRAVAPSPAVACRSAPSAPVQSAPAPLRYERDPAAIYEQSFATVEAEARLDHLPADLRAVAVRLVHACGMTDVAHRLAWSDDVVRAARTALAAGRPVLCDCEMVASGIIRARLPAANPVLCTLNDPRVPARARAIGNTRSAAAVELWGDRLAGAVVAIGNAPTALFHLLELIDAGAPRPAAILGFPVGFVGAAESKAELARDPRGAAYLTLRGRRGGSATAAAAVNALAAERP